ncbi:MAG TPA: tetratricopeptide repeat protein [Gemmataceae bacterium]|jgi:hypothetical protein|nr:tetratricopeptide repeat protein [Gemmataceae bacterium]
MFHLPFLYELSPLYLAQAALTVWMLVDANRRGVEYYWYWLILAFQPLGAWAYFVLYKAKDFHGGHSWLTGLFQRPPSLQELRRQAERLPTLVNRLELADRLVETGEYAEAQPHVEAMLAREPEHCQALFLSAQCQRGLGHPGQAVPPLQKLIARHPSWEDYKGWHTLIVAHREAGDLPGAVAQCRDLARVAPGLEHRCLLAEHLLETGEKVEARQVVAQGLEDYHYMTGPGRRRNRRWVGKAKQLLKQTG